MKCTGYRWLGISSWYQWFRVCDSCFSFHDPALTSKVPSQLPPSHAWIPVSWQPMTPDPKEVETWVIANGFQTKIEWLNLSWMTLHEDYSYRHNANIEPHGFQKAIPSNMQRLQPYNGWEGGHPKKIYFGPEQNSQSRNFTSHLVQRNCTIIVLLNIEKAWKGR